MFHHSRWLCCVKICIQHHSPAHHHSTSLLSTVTSPLTLSLPLPLALRLPFCLPLSLHLLHSIHRCGFIGRYFLPSIEFIMENHYSPKFMPLVDVTDHFPPKQILCCVNICTLHKSHSLYNSLPALARLSSSVFLLPFSFHISLSFPLSLCLHPISLYPYPF